MEPAPVAEESPSPAPPDRRKWLIIAFVIVIAAIGAAAVLPGLLATPPSGAQASPISGTVIQTTVPTPSHRNLTHRTPTQTIPVSPGTTPPETSPETSTPTPSGPPDFEVTISPTQATAAHGETVVYHITIDAQNGFSNPIHMELKASVLFFSQTEDLGSQEPPYPKTFDYPFTVPNNLPSGVTVNGDVTSTGGGITHDDYLTLTVQ